MVTLEVPCDSPEQAYRAVELADDFGAMVARLLPGVHARKATVAPGEGRVIDDGPVPGLLVDVPRRLVTIDGSPVRLAYREFELLKYLAVSAGRDVSRTELMHSVWGDVQSTPAISERTVDTHIQRLRAKLDGHGRSLVTVRGRGYRFQPADDSRIVLMHHKSQAGM